MIFEKPLPDREALRGAIDSHYRADESQCVRALLDGLARAHETSQRIDAQARRLVEAVRAERTGRGGIDAFLQEYGLSTQEGVLLMCVAEALLRVPDDETQERLIRDKISTADWDRHLGHSSSLFVNASTWALMLTGRLVRMHDYEGESAGATVRRLAARLGEPVVREAVNQAMRILGRQFVMGRTIDAALQRARPMEARGYRYSYDMLGEAARTMADAERYFEAYRAAIAAIGTAAGEKGVIEGPGISVKLSALHPRYEIAQAHRVMDELVPRLKALAQDAAAQGIGLTIDAEEAERLDLSLDAIEAVSGDPALAGWDGFGVVVQAYQKRAPYVLDWLADMAGRHKRRLPLRLVKGAYWDAEIKRAQELGLYDYPVFTRKASTDVSYLACAQRLFARPRAFYPQFATHNAHTIASILEFAGNSRAFEFQRLHGMGETLYEHVVEKGDVGVSCRIYAPVGQHEDLLAYLVRRLLENGANSSFVNRIQDERLPVEEIIADPVAAVHGLSYIPHPKIPLPRDLYGAARKNSAGIDLTDRAVLASLAEAMGEAAEETHSAGPIVGGRQSDRGAAAVVSPADRERVVGEVAEADATDVDKAVGLAARAARDWAALPVEQRAACLEKAADLLEEDTPAFMALCVREAGKTLADSVAEIREAADFCRYYAMRARRDFARPIGLRVPADGHRAATLTGGGVFACISPWNFPLAIFTGQVAAALAGGNAVIAKPAEQTPLIAARCVRLLHGAGVPEDVLHLVPGDGETVGGPLVADPRVTGVCFTGSTEVAQRINRTLAQRSPGVPPLIAETGGQNAMIVDSTALPEQVTRDVLISSFQSAGQRCSALRVLFLQEDVADRMIAMLTGAMEELSVGNPALLSTDIGPVIDEEAQAMLEGHAKRMRSEGRPLYRVKPGPGTDRGSFFGPAAFEIDRLSRLQREVFGPILHVIRYSADRLDDVIRAINDTGYGLTLGIHTRIDETWQYIFERAQVGNTYVNRNQIGAIVGVQPFGGERLSGTGPKAGGPHYLHRFVAHRPADGGGDGSESVRPDDVNLEALALSGADVQHAIEAATAEAREWASLAPARRAAVLEAVAARLEAEPPSASAAESTRVYAAQTRSELAGRDRLPGPTGERNELGEYPRGLVLCLCVDAPQVLVEQVAAALAAGNSVLAWHREPGAAQRVCDVFHNGGVPRAALHALAPDGDSTVGDLLAHPELAAVSLAGPQALAAAVNRVLAAQDGPIRQVIPHTARLDPDDSIGNPPSGSPHYLHRFTHERTLSIDTTASGGNASLLSLGEETR